MRNTNAALHWSVKRWACKLTIIVVSLMWTVAAMAVSDFGFEETEQVRQYERYSERFVLPLGRIKLDRDSGRELPEKSRILAGNERGTVWQVRAEPLMSTVEAALNRYVSARGGEILFHCRSRACGESFAWATEFFDEALLYGSDRSQAMWVIQTLQPAAYEILYLVQRPNRRRYLYHVVLQPEAMSLTSAEMSQQLAATGRVIAATLKPAAKAADIAALATRLAASEPLTPTLVLHQHGTRVDAGLAGRIQLALQAAGLKQITVKDVGSLAPALDAVSPVWLEWIDPDWMNPAWNDPNSRELTE